jgi:hypothetical protein
MMPRGAPSRIFSSESVKSFIWTRSWSRRAPSSAASLARLARSAPTMPGAGRERAEVDVIGQREGARVDLEDPPPALAIGRLHGHATIEAPGTQERGVEDVGAVRGAEDDDRLGALEAVHLGEDLVERLLALVVDAGGADLRIARPPDGVELVEQPVGARVYGWILLGAITVLIGAIAARTIVAGVRGQLLPSVDAQVAEKSGQAMDVSRRAGLAA